jgi:hypothetical protein
MSWKDDDCKHCAAATATLERVREVRNRMRNTGTIWGDELEAALAGQPEAPQCHAYVTGNPIDCGGCEEHVGQREATTLEANASLPPKRPLEAPKGQEADPIEAAHAFVSGSLERDLAAANARIEYLTAERIAERRLLSNELHRESIRLTAANARADAAERGNEEGTKQLTAMTAERDQLAARVRELEEAARVIQWEEW